MHLKLYSVHHVVWIFQTRDSQLDTSDKKTRLPLVIKKRMVTTLDETTYILSGKKQELLNKAHFNSIIRIKFVAIW